MCRLYWEHHNHFLPFVHAALVSVLLKLLCGCAEYVAMDPLKVFIGQLHADLDKPHVQRWLDKWSIRYVEIYMRPPNNWTRCCFISFNEYAAAQACTELDGCDDPDVTPTTITASIIVTQHGSLWSL